MKSRITIWVSICLLAVACDRDDPFIVRNKGIWQETDAYRILYVNGIPTDSTRQTGGFGQYRFRNNGHGSYSSDSLSADFDWYFEDATLELRICFQDNGILQCRTQTVQEDADDFQTWMSVNVIDSWTEENVWTRLKFVE